MRILITGSRNWSDATSIKAALLSHARNKKEVTVVHGGARGADALAGEVARQLGFNVEVHPADWDKHARAAGPIRNQFMIDLGADVCLAFPEGKSTGTRHCMKKAKEAGIPVFSFEDHSTKGLLDL